MPRPLAHLFVRLASLALLSVLCWGCAKGDTGFEPQQYDGGRDARPRDQTGPWPDVRADRGPTPDRALWADITPTTDKGTPTPDKGVPKPDLLVPDLREPDLRGPDQGAPHGGPLIITEFLANPKAVGDTAGEWLELTNVSSASIDLKGWTLADAGSDAVTFASSIVVGPGQRVLLGVDAKPSTNGGVSGVHAWGSGFVLANNTDEIILLDPTSKVIDRVEYTSSWVKDGASLSLRSTSLDNSLLASWCVEDATWATGSDLGTPGQPPHCQ